MSLRTPLGRVLGLGSAKEGTDHWVTQRISAVSNVLLGLWFIVAMAGLPGYEYLDVMRFVADPWNGVLLALLSVTLCVHSHLGIQVVIEDYVHTPFTKITALLLSRFAHVLIGVACVYAILRVGLGS